MADPEQEPSDVPATPPSEVAPAFIEPVTEPQLLAAEVGPPPRREVFPPWSAWDVAAVLCFTLAAVFLFSTLALGVAHIMTRHRQVSVADLASSPSVVVGAQVAAYPAVILFMIMLVRTKSRVGFWQAIRWNWPGPAMVIFPTSGVAFAFVVEFASHWLPIPKSLPVDKYFSDITGAYLMAGFGVTLAPLLEELFFRGMLYPLARRGLGVAWGMVVTAGAFAFIHGAQLGYAWAPLLSIFVVGMGLTLVRERTNSVAASFLVHCGYNFALFAMLWFGTDHFRHLEKALN